MWTELQRSGIFDDVAQWHTLSTFLETVTFVSACWRFCFPELPLPAVPPDEYESIHQLPHLDVVLEVLTLVRNALQIPMTAMSHTRHVVANRCEIYRCRMTACLLVCFLQRLISQHNGYIPPFFEELHFYKTSLLREIMYSSFADQRHLKSLRARLPDLYDFTHEPGHHQQPCIYIRISPWHPHTTLEPQIRMWQSARSTGRLRAGHHQHRARSLSSTRQSKCTRKRDRTVKSVTSSVAERYSRRPHRVHSQTIDSCYKVQNYEMQTLLPCPPAQWPEVSFSLRATSTGTCSLPMRTSSAAVAGRQGTI